MDYNRLSRLVLSKGLAPIKGNFVIKNSILRSYATTAQENSKKNLVILGTGWGSISLLKKLDTRDFNVTVVSPRNYFLFTPLLPSCTVGTLETRSIIEPIRYTTKKKPNNVRYVEANCDKIDFQNNNIHIHATTTPNIESVNTTIPYDYLVVGVGAETGTFGIPGVKEHACFLKEVPHAKAIRSKLSDCLELASFKNQSPEEQKRLLHMVVVGGGPTGVEYAAELHDYLKEDLAKWYPKLVDKFSITLIEAFDRLLPAFSTKLIDYTQTTFKKNNINVLTKSKVKSVDDKKVTVETDDGIKEIDYGILVWAAGNTHKDVVKNLISEMKATQTNPKGLSVNDHLLVNGSNNIFALGDATATQYSATAQVASQQGKYLAKVLKNVGKYSELTPSDPQNIISQTLKNTKGFEYTHHGSLAYIGSDKAVADLKIMNYNAAFGGILTYLFWRSVYLSGLFSIRNMIMVCADWSKTIFYGRDISSD
jgi:NADH:ubiquinone reductase (non-electrogenic)